MFRTFKLLIVAFVSILFVASCATQGSEPQPPTATATVSVPEEPTQTVTATVAPSSPTVEPTAVSTPAATTTTTPPSDINVVETDVQFVMAQADVTIYAGPGERYEAIGTIAGGQTALVTGTIEDGSWWRVICPDDRVGSCWVTAESDLTQPQTIAPGQPLAPYTLSTDVRFVMARETVPIRDGPDTDAEQIGQVEAGQIARVYGVSEDDEWWRVFCPDDTLGNCWVPADPTLTEPAAPPPASVDNAFAAILGPVDVPPDWSVEPCEGSGPYLCVAKNDEYVGSVEFATFPLETMPDFQQMLDDAGVSLDTLDSQDPEQRAAMVAALTAFVENYYSIFSEDRSVTYPEDVTFTPLPPEEIQFGSRPGVAYGFVGQKDDGSAHERWFLYSTFDSDALYTIVAFYDPSTDVGTFRSDEELVEFEPYLRDIVAGLRLENVSPGS